MTAREGSALLAGRLALVALFVTSLVTGQLLAVKVLALPLSFSLPVVGSAILVPAGVFAYALTFFATDCVTELYGRRPAERMVRTGFAMLFVMLALVYLAVVAPGSGAGVAPSKFADVMAPSANIVLGGMAAYLVSQHWDIFAFHAIRRRTGPDLLWVRNVGSTATSQAIDTVVFILLAFAGIPAVLGVGDVLSVPALASLVVGQYLLKLGIAVVDTPFVYAVVGALRRRGVGTAAAAD